MTKHPHRLMLLNKSTWRCTLDGCAFFVHLGLQHVLLGKNAVCWNCDEIFRLDEAALKNELPNCPNCRSGKVSGIQLDTLESVIEQRLAGNKSTELSEENTFNPSNEEKDEIETFEG